MTHLFRQHRHGSGAGFGLAGLIAGAGLAYWLFGTDSGNRKRGELMGYVKRMKDKVMDAKGDAVEYIEEDTKDAVALASRVKDHLKAIKQDIEETLG